MAFVLKRSNSIAVGSFNIYVFQPPDVGRILGLPDQAKMTIHSDFSRPGFKLTFDVTSEEWQVRPDRVLIGSDDPTADTGSIMEKVLKWLPVTPLIAIGHNFEFKGAVSDLPSLSSLNGFPTMVAEPGYAVKQRTWHISLERESVTYNLQATLTDEESELSVNVEFRTQGKSPESKFDFAAAFLRYRSESRDLLTRCLGVQVQ